MSGRFNFGKKTKGPSVLPLPITRNTATILEESERLAPEELSRYLRASVGELHSLLRIYDRNYGTHDIVVDEGLDVEQVWAQLSASDAASAAAAIDAAHDAVEGTTAAVVDDEDDDSDLADFEEDEDLPSAKRTKKERSEKEEQLLQELLARAEDQRGAQSKKQGKNKYFVFGRDADEEGEEVDEEGPEEEEEEEAEEGEDVLDDEASFLDEEMEDEPEDDEDNEALAHQLMYGTDDEDDEDNDEGREEQFKEIAEAAEEVEGALTAFQRQQRGMKDKIKEQEERLMAPKHWTLQGEITSRARPKDSLLDEALDTEFALKQVPVCTEEMTATIEERIKQRIMNSSYDDVVRKQKMTTAADLVTNKRDAAIEGEKSKISLMDLYEKDYLEKLKSVNADTIGNNVAKDLTQQEKDELKAVEMWKHLSGHLDALSNFFYTPKPILQHDDEMRVRAIQGNVGAVSIEDRGVAGGDEVRAPGEIHKTKSSRHRGIADEELTHTERKRNRNANKEAAKKRNVAHSKLKKEAMERKALGKTAAPKAYKVKSIGPKA
eukprot:PhM_4_TR10981/c0_g1_i1/m.81947/K14559/MPP10; U3 small nucleolar RNA-associated protein MPP10